MADDLESTISSPTLVDAIVAVKSIQQTLSTLQNTAADSAVTAEVAAAQAVEAKNQTQILLSAATGGTTTPFTATLLLAPTAENFKSQLAIPAESAPVIGGKIPASYLPPQTLVNVVTVADQAAMLALNPAAGSTTMAIRSDVPKTFVLSANLAANVLANWVELPSPSGGVDSVAGLTGVVAGAALKTALALVKGDVGLGNVPNVDATNADNLGSGTIALARLPAAVIPYGRQTIWIPAAAMVPATTNGAAVVSYSTPTNAVPVALLGFDGTTQESAWFQLGMPTQWNEGTVTFAPVFSQATTAAGAAVFDLAGVATGDGASFDAVPGTAQLSTKAAGTANITYVGPESAAITLAGTVAAGTVITFRVRRVPANAGDTLAQDARLHGIYLYLSTDAGHD
jgi:hypothetical protein